MIFLTNLKLAYGASGAIFPIGKICRYIVEFNPWSQEIHLWLSVRR